jgi:heme exporter protein C
MIKQPATSDGMAAGNEAGSHVGAYTDGSQRHVGETFAKIALFVLMAWVIYGAFVFAPPAQGFRNEALARMLFFHVPNAIAGSVVSTISALFALRYLAKRRWIDDVRSKALASLAMLFWLLTTFTGAVFAKVQWGAYWNWDPKQSAMFVLLLLYLAYFALRAGIADPDKQAASASAYIVFAAVTVPFLTYILPNATPDTLHPKDVIWTSGGMDLRYKLVFWSAVLAWLGIAGWIFRLQVGIERIGRALDRKLETTSG